MTLDERSIRATRGIGRLLAAVTVAATLFTGSADALAADGPVAVGEISPLPSGSGTDAAVVRDVAASEIRQIDLSRLAGRRKFVVSISLTKITKALADGAVACTVNAMLRDARTGAMIAIIEAGAQADGPSSTELRKQVAHAAIRSAMRRIPKALGGS